MSITHELENTLRRIIETNNEIRNLYTDGYKTMPEDVWIKLERESRERFITWCDRLISLLKYCKRKGHLNDVEP